MKIAVFCGYNFGEGQEFRRAATELGSVLAQRKIGLIYGGAAAGLMGLIADAALAEGGEVIGIIPKALHAREGAHPSLSELVVVPTLQDRKDRQRDLADAFIAMPGGLGTIDELISFWAMNQLGEMDKPIGVLNVSGYYDSIFSFFAQAQAQGFFTAGNKAAPTVNDNPTQLVDAVASRIRVT
ncbi:TIGR00730 family Rossman fold protein [Mesorhizobium sp. B3-1-6]|uniref:LOG family protein n=1 Tax=Mesorhizobium sp. B3-1-6 TaxID=2589895 RepID=UPI00112AFFE1|nr:TIGR00730 family Rossman fold protein [Mesorhizobium sp. B3-1-6]TPI29433.1 TIGR00730 family Rossman fold protein [Mesorhizobium sp. B3-1-6]